MYTHVLTATGGPAFAGSGVARELVVASGSRGRPIAMTAIELWPVAHKWHSAAAIRFDAHEKAANATTSKVFPSTASE